MESDTPGLNSGFTYYYLLFTYNYYLLITFFINSVSLGELSDFFVPIPLLLMEDYSNTILAELLWGLKQLKECLVQGKH